MLKENTIKREMRRLRKIVEARSRVCDTTEKFMSDKIAREAYGAECFAQWVLGGCTWTPSGIITK